MGICLDYIPVSRKHRVAFSVTHVMALFGYARNDYTRRRPSECRLPPETSIARLDARDEIPGGVHPSEA
jgi:hypothetical protein